MNPVDGIEDFFHKNIDFLNSTIADDESVLRDPDYQFFVTYDFDYYFEPKFPDPVLFPVDSFRAEVRRPLTLFNQIAFLLPPSPLLSQRDWIPDRLICNSTSLKGRNCTAEFCWCTHILKVAVDSVVELIFIDRGMLSVNPAACLHLYYH